MRLPFSNGGYIQQRYALESDGYMVQNELSFVGLGNVIPRNVSMVDVDWSLIVPRLEKGFKNEMQYSKLNYYFSGDKKPEILGRGRDGSKRIDTKMKWFAFQQQFFSAIMTSKSEFASADLGVDFYSEEEYKSEGKLMACTAKLRSDFQAGSDNIVIPYEFYFGPNDYKTLKSYDQKYEKVVALGGWLVAWFSRLIIIPTFKDCPLSNQRVYEQICQFTKRMKVNIEMVEADDLVKVGGAFNCASWTTTQQALTGEHYIRRGKI